ncbi:tryptophan synthase subunit alpha [Marinomonas mediterranea]|jgi:tryptophan synthase, alpha subunit|uniref:Tryptophan synthase alpha chain n=1 Tax=Marinomonas mediterranea (strain ATCC 700492 / JCM 21426 / NBRC 103028 / MMB-1) TaxID=717774 RepID=F2JZZ6_MARM1|nr:tryptophan synthase subunit alpha [Marinomonas mediterranea]ADZ92108.1 Tryptophan synthase alpha chain [Marinomonas mediterranea MMB-1]WCN10069.1 tryptophan synthase subunit alpha [Marinomonas mediterranea]WCN14120.1 tryptophan synthase subunit alpha [Marinomonas mediterranea]WCN18175.1 tryptophan synthase subunit alpha [Marinomonas mediterranea MMB-1]
MSQLANYINAKRESKPILSMTHVVYGYPTVEESLTWMGTLLENGADFIEVQFPFSDPVADGPTIVAACHKALEQTLSVEQCLKDIGQLAKKYPESRLVLMSYLNPMYRYGLDKLVERCAEEGILGLILPDLPYEQAGGLRAACDKHGIDPVWLVTPVTPKDRMAFLASNAQGFLYCVARSGVTGNSNHDGEGAQTELQHYLASIQSDSSAPLGVGFGLRRREQIKELEGHADIAILGSALLDAYNQGGQETGIALFKELFSH